VYLTGEPQALRLAQRVADYLGLSHSRLRVLGAGMDHEPFAALGLPSVSILGDVVRSSFALHSPRDNMALIDPAGRERAGRLAARLAWRWAELPQPESCPNSDAATVVAGELLLPSLSTLGSPE